MKVVSIIAYILAGILIIFGVLFILAAFGEIFNPGWLLTGLVLVAIAFGLIFAGYYIGRRAKQAAQERPQARVAPSLQTNHLGKKAEDLTLRLAGHVAPCRRPAPQGVDHPDSRRPRRRYSAAPFTRR